MHFNSFSNGFSFSMNPTTINSTTDEISYIYIYIIKI